LIFIILSLFVSLSIISCSSEESTTATTDNQSTTDATTTLSAPSDFTTTAGDTKVTFSWTAVSGASSYTLYWGTTTGITSSSTTIRNISTNSYSHTGLSNGTTYYYKVAAVNSAGTGTLSSELSAAPASSSDNSSSSTTLSAPSGLSASGAAAQVALDWTAVSGASSYTMYWDNSTGVSTSSNAITSISTDNYTHSSLDNGTAYYYKVATVNSAGTGTLSSEVNATTLVLLAAPDNVSASGASGTITLNWNAVSGADNYTLYWDNVSGITSSDTAIPSISNDNYTHSSLSDGTYYYKVAAVNDNGTGALSAEFSSVLASNIQGSETYNAHTYAITTSAMTYANAKAAAAALGGYLTTINTLAENTFLTTEFYGTYGNAIWIGANDIDTEGTWIWDNGTTSSDNGLTDNISTNSVTWADNSTKKWNGSEPNNSGNEDCANITNSGGKWNDLPCTSSLYGVIEFD
jgi:hypothetical protein